MNLYYNFVFPRALISSKFETYILPASPAVPCPCPSFLCPCPSRARRPAAAWAGGGSRRPCHGRSGSGNVKSRQMKAMFPDPPQSP